MADVARFHASARDAELAELRETFLAALLAPDARAARMTMLEAADAGVPVGRLHTEVLRPALHTVGRLWEEAHIGVAQEHLATQIAASVLAQLAGRLTGDPAAGDGRTAIVSCSPGERHVLGGQMVADVLEANGWHVLLLGADVPPAEVAALVTAHDVELVALSTALPAHLLAAALTCTTLRRLPAPPLIVVGGQAYRGDRRRALAVGADELAADAEELLRLVSAPARGDALGTG